MESFGFWYKLVEDKDDKNPEFDLHVNFWFLGDILKGKIRIWTLELRFKIIRTYLILYLAFRFMCHKRIL